MDPALDFKSLQDSVSASLVKAIRTAGQISAEDLSFQRSFDPDTGVLIDEQSSRLLTLAKSLLSVAASGTDYPTPRLNDVESVDNKWPAVVEVIDNLLEKADICLDEYTGLIKKHKPDIQEQPSPPKKKPRQKLNNTLRTQDIPKPQLLFNEPPKNEEDGPFRPLLRSKPHATVPLDQSLSTYVDDDGLIQYQHPYAPEITQYSYPQSVYTKSEPIKFPPFESTTATLVDTPEAVSAMLSELRNAKEIAIDLEHHDARSYVGLVSLMQISTRDKDWIVDTLKPWRRDLEALNEVFADPNILKVFHGAHMDIVWLQRDLGLYVVGLFDTYHAARTLGYPQASLAALLSRWVNFDADKQYQMADWRIRPLPEAMFDYARSDTHFLLYIYDNMKNQLVEASTNGENRVDVVLRKSKETALQRYERFVYNEARGTGALGWLNMLSRTPALFNKEQFAVFRAVHRWRDMVARAEDESLNFVMSKHNIFTIAREMPMDTATLLSVSHPISKPLRRRLDELLKVIQDAKKAGVNGPSMMDVLQQQLHQHNIQGDGTEQNHEKADTEVKAAEILPQDPKISIRACKSVFWGSTIETKALKERKSLPLSKQSVQLALPLPQLTADIFETPGGDQSATPRSANIDPGARATHQYTKERVSTRNPDDGVFVVKELGNGSKRKRAATGEESQPDLDEGGIYEASEDNPPANFQEDEMKLSLGDDMDYEAEQAKRAKAERKAARKLRKQQKQAEEDRGGPSSHGSDSVNDSEIFDYSKAETVLHAKGRDRDSSKATFAPYKKVLDAPQGMRRSQKEKSGKSFTFRE